MKSLIHPRPSPVILALPHCPPFFVRVLDHEQIPDLPPHGELYPLGTDETERTMLGQEFIPVEGIFTASSDGLTCIVSRIGRR